MDWKAVRGVSVLDGRTRGVVGDVSAIWAMSVASVWDGQDGVGGLVMSWEYGACPWRPSGTVRSDLRMIEYNAWPL